MNELKKSSANLLILGHVCDLHTLQLETFVAHPKTGAEKAAWDMQGCHQLGKSGKVRKLKICLKNQEKAR